MGIVDQRASPQLVRPFHPAFINRFVTESYKGNIHTLAEAMAVRRRGPVICPSCGTWNRDEALFCKYCGADVSKVPKPAALAPPPTPVTPAAPPIAAPPPPHITPRPARPRAWWHGLGVFVILAAFFLVLDAGSTGRLTWSLVA